MKPFDTPILFLVFNRPDTTQLVFDKIRELQPQKLYVAADGPRHNKENEADKVKLVRQICSKIDWDCEVEHLYRTINLGCGKAVSDAISWFFEREEEGIILEDDCLPDMSFFIFCKHLLEKYRHDEQIMHISGNSFCTHKPFYSSSYYYSKFPFIWGWATWKRAWLNYDFKYHGDSNLERTQIISKAFRNPKIQQYWQNAIDQHVMTDINLTWDYQWFYSIWRKNGNVILPAKNLVSNIGFGEDATHTKDQDSRLASYEVTRMLFPLVNPVENEIKDQTEEDNFYNFYSKRTSKSESIKNYFMGVVNKLIKSVLFRFVPESRILFNKDVNWNNNNSYGASFSKKVKFYAPYSITNTKIGDYTYIAPNSLISNTEIGKFCSIGPNLFCGWGIHPTNGLSTNPMFYSTRQQNGFSLVTINKVEERKIIKIGNDVFIGANVTILDGIEIGDGAVIGAGAIVSKNIPPYSIAVGAPIQIIKRRFDDETIKKLLHIKWWDWNDSELVKIEKNFFEVDTFIKKYENKNNQH